MPMTISLLGYGAVGGDLVRYLEPELAAGRLLLAGVVVRFPEGRPDPPHGAFVPLDRAVGAADLVVECAGVPAAREHGPRVIAAGTDLLLASMGALAHPDTAAALTAGPGRLIPTSGAIGGLDTIRAIAQAGGLDELSITVHKDAATLVQPWMDDPTGDRLRSLTEPEELFCGTPQEAIERFPRNVNIAVALGVAARGHGTIADGLARVRVRIVADPQAGKATHVIEAHGSTGDYYFEFANRPSPDNPRSSALTAQSLAADVRQYMIGWPGV